MPHSDFAPPPASEIHRSGASSWAALRRQGEAIGAIIREKLIDHGLPPDLRGRGGRVLDFGAGTGRVALALERTMGLPTDACDINEAAMTHLAGQLPGVRCAVNRFEPPLPFAGETFDAVYAVSVWSHLPPSAGLVWLGEIARVTRPGGLALITVCGPRGVRRRRDTHQPGWSAVGEEDIERMGALFLPLDAGTRPGAGGEFGLSAYSHRTILDTWDPIIGVEAIYADVFEDGQDLVVLRRTALPPRGMPLAVANGKEVWRRLTRKRRR